uniref:Putative ribosome subunit s24 n=1 Tax=Lutzomyia longipalpis TaxID=7200 RepID=A0A1B0GJU3_LUTLO
MSALLVQACRNGLAYRLGQTRSIHVSTVLEKKTAGKYKTSVKKDRPLTYEMSQKPHHIAVRKGYNSLNTSNLLDGLRSSETAVEDMFIRKFMVGTWHGLVLSEVIIKRQFNHIRIAAMIRQGITAQKMYFLIGYTEEMLARWLHCPVTLELETTPDKKDIVFKYI